jgi:hypothetical protein
MLKPDQQADLVESHTAVFAAVKGGWGRRGSTAVRLDAADNDAVILEAMKTAWGNKAGKRP